MDQINRGIDDMVVTPSILPVVGKTRTSPSSTTKFIERSLHDLDDLIQQRRLELSALRKSNRKRLNDQFSVGVSRLIENSCTSITFILIYH